MYGARGRIGLLTTTNNTTLEPDFNRRVPVDVSVHAARVRTPMGETNAAVIEEMAAQKDLIAERIRDLADTKVKVMLYGCTSGAFAKGPAADEQLQKDMSGVTGIPCVTPTSASVEALRTLGLSRITVTTPYPRDVNQRLVAYFAATGIEVVHIGGFEEADILSHAFHEPGEIYEMAKSIDRPEAQGMFISCTQLRALEAVDRIERDLKKPVVTVNQASLWKCLSAIGVTEPLSGSGRLLAQQR